MNRTRGIPSTAAQLPHRRRGRGSLGLPDDRWTRSRAWLLVALALALGTVLPPVAPPAAAQSGGGQGLMSGWVVDDAGRIDFEGSRVAQFAAMRQAGAGWVRIEFRLGPCFTDWVSPGCATAQAPNALGVYTLVVNEARAQGLQVLGLIDYTSWYGTQDQWTMNNAEHHVTERYGVCRNEAGRYSGGCNPYIETFAQHAVSVLASYFDGVNGPLVEQWEIWNEPNAFTSISGAGMYSGGYFIYPSNFAWMLRLSYEAIKRAQPNAVVISGGLFALDVTEPQPRSGVYTPVTPPDAGTTRSRCTGSLSAGQSGATYLCAVYEMGRNRAGWRPGATPFDHVGQHLYVDQWKRTTRQSLMTYLQELRYAYREFEGDATRKQIHVTEVGWTTDQISPAIQAENLQTAFDQTFRTTPFVGRAYWFFFRDEPAAALSYGLTDAEGNLKPAYAAFQRYAAY